VSEFTFLASILSANISCSFAELAEPRGEIHKITDGLAPIAGSKDHLPAGDALRANGIQEAPIDVLRLPRGIIMTSVLTLRVPSGFRGL
jgi:hypothetical protein